VIINVSVQAHGLADCCVPLNLPLHFHLLGRRRARGGCAKEAR
jgi:hypothetical protein